MTIRNESDRHREEAASARLRRSPPERTGPIRNPSTFMRGELSKALHPAARAVEPAQRAIEAAVEGAYRVFEDYLDWGRKAAEQQLSFEDWKVPMAPKPMDYQQASAQWLQLWQDAVARFWFGAFAPFTPNGGQQPTASNPWSAFMSPGAWGMPPFGPRATPSHDHVRMNVTIEASQPVKLALRLIEAAPAGAVRAVLHREDGEGKLTLELDASGTHLCVPPGQPSGVYSGVLRDQHGAQCGMVTVSVGSAGAE